MNVASVLHGRLVKIILDLRLWVCKKTGLKLGTPMPNVLTLFLAALMLAFCTSLLDFSLSALFGIWVGRLTYLIDVTVAVIITRTLLFPR